MANVPAKPVSARRAWSRPVCGQERRDARASIAWRRGYSGTSIRPGGASQLSGKLLPIRHMGYLGDSLSRRRRGKFEQLRAAIDVSFVHGEHDLEIHAQRQVVDPQQGFAQLANHPALAAIDERDDWSPFEAKLADIRELRDTLGLAVTNL